MNWTHRLGIHTGKYTTGCDKCRARAVQGLRDTFRRHSFNRREVPSPYERAQLREMVERSDERVSQADADRAWESLLKRAKR